MTTITVCVEDNIEASFRRIASKLHSGKKGFLGDAITEAMNEWIEVHEQKKIARRQLQLLEKGFAMGKIKTKQREEIYAR